MELSIDFRNWRTWNAVPESSEMVYLEPLIPDRSMSWESPSDRAMCNFIHRILKFSVNSLIFSDLEDNWNCWHNDALFSNRWVCTMKARTVIRKYLVSKTFWGKFLIASSVLFCFTKLSLGFASTPKAKVVSIALILVEANHVSLHFCRNLRSLFR
jgi:hypothetical protein